MGWRNSNHFFHSTKYGVNNCEVDSTNTIFISKAKAKDKVCIIMVLSSTAKLSS